MDMYALDQLRAAIVRLEAMLEQRHDELKLHEWRNIVRELHEMTDEIERLTSAQR